MERCKSVLLCTTTHNSGSVVDKWLKYWTNLVEDIVVIDQDSKDDTLEILNKYPEVQVFNSPNLGLEAPALSVGQTFAAYSNKWFLRMGVNETISSKQFVNLVKLADKVTESEKINTLIIPRKHLVDGVDCTKIFKAQNDPNGKDYQMYMTKGISLGLNFHSHLAPHVEGRWILVKPEVAQIVREETFEDYVKSNIILSRFLPDNIKQAQGVMIQRVAELLNISIEKLNEVVLANGEIR